jgi:hypothetical protein
MEVESKVYKFLVRQPEEKRAFRRPSHRWESGITMDLRESGWGCSGFRWLKIVTDGGS